MSNILSQRWLLSRRHFLRGLGATMALPGNVNTKIRYCTTIYTQDLLLKGQQDIKALVDTLRHGDLNVDRNTDLVDFAIFQREFATRR